MDTAVTSLEIIREYKKHDILWRPTNPLYYNKVQKEEAWSKMSLKLNCGVEELKRKIDSLKGSYRREKAKTRRSIIEKGEEGRYVSRWFAFKSLKFLDGAHNNAAKNSSEFDEDNIAYNAEYEDSEFITVKEEIMSTSEGTEEMEDDILNQTEVPKRIPVKRKLLETDDAISEDSYIDPGETSLKLISEFKKHEILWKPSHRQYYNKRSKDEAWSELSLKFSQWSIDELKRKIESLKASYRREKSRIRKSSNDSVTGKYVPRWYAFKSLRFLDVSSSAQDNEANSSELDEENATCNGECSDSDFITVKEEILPTSEYNEEMEEDVQIESEIPKSRPVMHQLPQADDSMSGDLYNYPQQICDVTVTKKDQCSLFGEYIIEKMRSFDSRLRAVAQHKISNLLFELEMTTFKTPNGNCSHCSGFQQMEKETNKSSSNN